jgi:protein involved in polysaccharide export with SLBB domain
MLAARLSILTALLCLLLCPAAAFGQQFGGPAGSAGAPTALQQGTSYSKLPANTPTASRLPSGQGSAGYAIGNPVYAPTTPGALYPEPLYAPGMRYNDARPFTGMPAWQQQGKLPGMEVYPPFGANLFQGYFAGTYYEGLNPGYTIMPGDRIQVNIWGAHAYNDILMVDQQGNIFLPEVGPVRVAGMSQGDLLGKVRQHLSAVFKTNVEIYVNLLTAQPVAVYVTGFVSRPGRYAGGMNDSPLYYLDRAGGIIPDRGTYRNIRVQRHGKTISMVDLYDFILNGKIADTMLQDGDVIVVGKRGNCVMADGLIPQHASYESKGKAFGGGDLINLAAPLPAASHVSITGTRKTLPFHVYLPLAEFAHFSLAANDKVEFLADRPGESIMISVSGSILGPTRYPVKRNTRLREVLSHIPIDPGLSNLDGIYIKRKSVVEQQRKAIHDALRRLESSVLTATSANQESAAIRVQEAQLVQTFSDKVSALEPDGVVVVTRQGYTSDIIMEDGDEIVIPQRSDIVQVSGEVMVPKAVVYAEGQDAMNYVRDAGGYTDRADENNILVAHPNGEIQLASATNIGPGDMLLVMPRYDSKGFSIFKDIVQILYQVAIATKVVVSM